MWMAPNMVTLLGFMWIVGNIFIIEIFVEDMVGPVSVPVHLFIGSGELTRHAIQGPAWIYFSFALGMWM